MPVRHTKDESEPAAGHDSFLDVVTNIVGILILLVMVVGLRSAHAVATAAAEHDVPATPPVSQEDVHEAARAAAVAEKEVRELIRRTVTTRDEALLREQERHWLQTAVAETEQEIAERRARLNAQDQHDFDLRRRLSEAQITLEKLAREQIALASQDAECEQIECEPTPLARVVTGKEVHVLLSDDHVAIVPFDELLELLKADMAANIWRLRQQDEVERTIGPVNGFRLRYWFIKTALVARTEAGTLAAGTFSQFSHCHFLPVTTPLGEPAEEALGSNSEFQQVLRRLRPDTTVTVWTYPGNYDRLREIKRTIREFGLQVAIRPLPTGIPIGASRHGSESVSE